MPPPMLTESGVPAEGSRGWHDRRWADGEVPEKIKKITGWKRAMKTFMNQDPKLNDLVQLFTQKFVQLGQSKNFTLSTLMDLAWTVLILTWEAVLSEKLPMMDEVERGFKEKYEDLQQVMMEMRSTYLEEVTYHRDRFREDTLSSEMMAALNEINDGEDHGVYRLKPEIALDAKTMEYFKAAMVENLKIAMTRGASAAGETVKALMAQLAEAMKEIESLKAQLEDALLQLKLLEGREPAQKAVRRESRPAVNNSDADAKRLQAENEALKKEVEELRAENDRFRKILELLGIDPNSSLDDIRKMLKKKNQPEDDGGKEDAEKAAAASKKRQAELEKENAELKKKIALLEKELEELKKKPVPTGDKAAKELADKVKELEQEIERLKKALADAQNAKPAAGNDEALRKRCEELEKQLAMLKKQLNAKGDSGTKDLLKRNEELEAEVQRLNSKIELMNKELSASKRDAAAARQELAETQGKLQEAEEELEKLRNRLQDALDQLGNQKPRVKKEAPAKTADTPAPRDRSGEVDELQAELDEARAEIRKLKDKLKKSKEDNERLEKENQELKDALEEAIAMRKALEAAMEELRRQIEEFKKLLQDRGIDVTVLDEALAAAGLPLNPMSVFDRLYMDALRRFKRLEEKFYVDIQQAQKENWERLLGIHRGRAINRMQLEQLSAQGLIDIRNFPVAAEEPERSRELSSRSPSPSRSGSPKVQFSRSRLNEGLDGQSHLPSLSLNVVAMISESGRPYSVVSEEGSYAKHHQLQLGQELSRSRSVSPEGSRTLSQTLPAQRSRRPSRSPSPSAPSRSQLARSQTEPLMLSGQGQSPSVFEFPGPYRAPRSPPVLPAKHSPSRYNDGRETNLDDGRWLRGSPQLIIEPLLLPLQQQRRPAPDTDISTPLGKLASAESNIPKLSSPVADPLKLGYVQMLMPDPAFSPLAVKAASKMLPQIVTPPSHAGKLEKLPGSAGNLGLSRSQSLSGAGMGDKPAVSHHRVAKAPLQKVNHQGMKQDIMITGIAQTRTAPT